MKVKGPQVKLPGIPETGFLDPATFPIEPALKQALSNVHQEFFTAVTLLRSMYNYGRPEAGVFLVGLLLTCGDDWHKRTAIVTALYDVQTEACVKLLFGQLKTVKNTTASRHYLNEVLGVLSCMPPTLVRQGFEELAEDSAFTYRMRAKFAKIVLDLADRQRRGPK